MCDAGHPVFGEPVVSGRRGGMVVNLETRKNLLGEPFSKAWKLNELTFGGIL